MFATLSRIVAFIAVIGGAAQYALGFSIASGWLGPYEQALARYTGKASSGEVINMAIVAIVIGHALGTLAEIARAVRTPRQ